MIRLLFVFLAVVVALCPCRALEIPNFSFEKGEENPTGWTLSGETGAWVDGQATEGERSVSVSGDGSGTGYWRSERIDLRPESVYRLSFSVRRAAPGPGLGITGPVFCNRDLSSIGENWDRQDSVFVTPRNLEPDRSWIRFGHWRLDGTIFYDEIRLYPVQPIYRHLQDLVLGEGETVVGNSYTFRAPFFQGAGIHSRPLVDYRASFNTNRWVFGQDSEVVYRHRIGDREQKRAALSIAVNYYVSGTLSVQASADGRSWQALGALEEQAQATFPIPESFLPARDLWVRLSAEAGSKVGTNSDPGSFQVNHYIYEATLSGEPLDLVGATRFLDVHSRDPDYTVAVRRTGDLFPGGENVIVAGVTNHTDRTIRTHATVSVAAEDGKALKSKVRINLAPGRQEVRIPYEIRDTGNHLLRFAVGRGEGFLAELPFHVSELYRGSYGRRLPGSDDQATLWWASSGWKISRVRPAPREEGAAVVIRAARNETEAAQLVICPARPLSGFFPECSPLRGRGAAVISPENIELLRVQYVNVTLPTDHTGAAAPWPDPLPPFRDPIDLSADCNQPVWVRVHVPHVPAGLYKGTLSLSAEDYSETVPLHVEVYDFSLPNRMTCVTAFGLSPGNVWNYHRLREPEQQREVLDKYLASFSAHHISPYDPAPLDPIRIHWPEVTPETKPEELIARIDWDDWDRAMHRAVDYFHFNSFRLPVQGLGGGSFHSRREPEILGFGEDTPQYRTAFQSYIQAVETHLREKGWLDEAFVYWFDEPAPEDYEFVMNGFRKLRENAPGINRMLTEQVEPELVGGPNIWCPVSFRYDHEAAEERRKHGEKFWWYVCTGPKAPYCTLFIDHPATELRVWLWQTWKRKIDGILIWQATYWTSHAAYPDSLQNPYEDPMGWVSSYGTAPGVKKPWGNGDGRFIYPPESAVDGTRRGPILEGPVDSIRWEMLRDGIEDYEYLAILKRLLRTRQSKISRSRFEKLKHLLQVPEEITEDMTTFTLDPEPIEERRNSIARAIEALWRL